MGSMLSSMNSNPLISIFVSFHLLVLLYASHWFLRLLFSPVLICTGVLLAGILHLGTIKKQKQLESTPTREKKLESTPTTRQKHPESTTKKQKQLESTAEKQKQLESTLTTRHKHLESTTKKQEQLESTAEKQKQLESTPTTRQKHPESTTKIREQLESTAEKQKQLESTPTTRQKHLESTTEKQEQLESTAEKQKQLEYPNSTVETEDSACEKEEEWGEGECEKEEEPEQKVVYRPERRFSDIFVEWHRRAPLEVIYEDSEGEKGEEAGDRPGRPPPARERQETCSLSLCYPDSDSDSSSDDGFPVIDEWEHPENRYFRWEEEKDDGLIEIPIFLGGDRCRPEGRGPGRFPVDEDNLIEIDLFHQTVVKRPDFPARIQAAT